MINEHFLDLSQNYLFSEIAQRVRKYKEEHPNADIIRLGIGDVTRPLPEACIKAMHKAVDEMSQSSTFRGYGPEQGYEFLRQAIVDHDFAPRGISLDIDEIFISDGAKSDCGNMGDIFSTDCSIGVTNPVYPVYIDSNVMSGRAGRQKGEGQWANITLLPATSDNNFTPQIPDHHIDLIYLCYPNNPTGTVITREALKQWVDYALRHQSIILYDAAYEAYIRHDNIPHSIYEIEGAKRCAIEFHSYSKTAGFTGVRCGYTVVPKDLTFTTSDGRQAQLNTLWNRRQCTKFNGTSYITQRAAEAIYSPEGKEQVRQTIDYYMDNAHYLRQELQNLGFSVYGGEDAPYVWLKTPEGTNSWQFFDLLLHRLNIVTTPGAGFGSAGEGYIRLTAFGKREDYIEAIRRFKTNKI